ncbi:MAG: hypothetical protein RIQ99_2037, partial [Pseudomonadota bacterium]
MVTQTDLLTYDGHYYRVVFDQNVSRSAALSAAANSTFTLAGITYHGYLGTVTSSGEENFIESSITAQNSNAYYSFEPASFWLGGEYVAGQWTWTSGPDAGNLVTYSDWGGSEASQGTGQPYLVLNMFARSDINGAWYSFEETATPYIRGYIIEYKADNTAPTFSAATRAVSASEDSAATITVSATDADSDPLTYTISTAATHGTTSVSGGTI